MRQKIRVLGRLSQPAALAEAYAQASVYVLPSYYEPFGLSAVEAMTAGLPVVVSSACGVAEVLTDEADALVVPPGSAVELAEALRRILTDDPFAAAVSRRGQVLAAEQLSWSAVVRRMAPILDGYLVG